MNFIMISENVKQITCMKLAPNRRSLLVAEQHKDGSGCFLAVYDVKDYVAQKMYNISELAEGRGNTIINGQSVNLNSKNNDEAATGPIQAADGGAGNEAGQEGSQNRNKRPKIIVDFNFSSSSAHLIVIAITDEVDSRVVVFDWSFGRVIASAEWKRVQINRVTFNPSDDTREVCVSGHNIWGLYAIKDGTKDGILNPTNKNFLELITRARRHTSAMGNIKTIFTEHCWLDTNRLIGCTQTGEMYYLEDYLLKRVHENAF